jgi:hypothetical protein
MSVSAQRLVATTDAPRMRWERPEMIARQPRASAVSFVPPVVDMPAACFFSKAALTVAAGGAPTAIPSGTAVEWELSTTSALSVPGRTASAPTSAAAFPTATA